MYKIISKRFKDSIMDLEALRKEFPGGTYTNEPEGITIFFGGISKEYGKEITLDNGDIFYAPSEENKKILINSLEKYLIKKDYLIPVKLSTGITISIYPGVMEPKKIFFGNNDITVSEEPSTEYGKATYRLFDAFQAGEIKTVMDKRSIDVLTMALKNTYSLPLVVWNSLEVFSHIDIDGITLAAVGINKDEELKKKLETES
jgi:hypothetical protein